MLCILLNEFGSNQNILGPLKLKVEFQSDELSDRIFLTLEVKQIQKLNSSRKSQVFPLCNSYDFLSSTALFNEKSHSWDSSNVEI